MDSDLNHPNSGKSVIPGRALRITSYRPDAVSGVGWIGNQQHVNHGTELQRRFSTLLDQHAGIVWRVAFAWCRQEADREDLVQEIHYQLWRAFAHYDSNRTFSTWMYRIALNVAISNDRRRKRTRAERLQDFPEPKGLIHRPAEDSRIAELFHVIDSLDGTNRAMLLLWLDDHSYASIAEVLGLSETNVATRLSRLKQKLKAHFD